MDLVQKAVKIVEDKKAGKMLIVDFEKEPLAYVDKNSLLHVRPHWNKGKFMDWNLVLTYDDGTETLLENYDDNEDITGKQLALNTLRAIRKGIDSEATYYVLPSN